MFAHERQVESIEQAQTLSRTRYCWVIHYLLDYSDFDFLWEPVPWQAQFVHVWPTQWDQFFGTYLIPKNTQDLEYHYHSNIVPSRPHRENYNKLISADFDFDFDWLPHPWDPPYIYVFGNQWHDSEVMPTLEYCVPGATERKYVDWPRATLRPDITRWTIPTGIDATTVDFSWVPDPGDPPYIYEFATQHQKTGGPVYTVPGATEIKYVDVLDFEFQSGAVPVVEIDHMDGNAGQMPNVFKRIRYFDNYRDTLIRLANSLVGQCEFVWVCSSVCDYSNFDFSWHPEKWQSTMLHVFASDEQKFGDTFLLHVPTFAQRAGKKALLEWYSVNYVPNIRVPRRPMPVFAHQHDSHVDAVKTIDFSAPLALFTTEPHLDRACVTVPLWRQEVKTITPISHGATAVIVPKLAVSDIKTQLYDYPRIDKTKIMFKSQPLDIVFVDNGESVAEHNINWLKRQLSLTNHNNKLHHISNVNGRVAAYHAAARASTTPWFFAVFAKLEVDPNFDWSWQPDRMQQVKHYIFHARNPVNGLEYGHQAMIAYNRELTLANPGLGLDFTLDSPHEVIPMLSGTAYYNASPWMAWRTAFREVLKLRASLPDIENEYRLNKWLNFDNTDQHIVNESWSRWGAEDAVEYYESVNGNFEDLKKSYEWQWLASFAFVKRGLTPDQ